MFRDLVEESQMFQPAEALALAAQKHTRREQASSQKTFAETSDIASQYAASPTERESRIECLVRRVNQGTSFVRCIGRKAGRLDWTFTESGIVNYSRAHVSDLVLLSRLSRHFN